MKLFIFAISILSILSAAQNSQACEPPRQQYSIQSIELKKLFSDPVIEKTIFEYVGNAGLVESVNIDKGLYTIELDNICKIVAKPVWKNPGDVGPCPEFKGFEVVKATCNE